MQTVEKIPQSVTGRVEEWDSRKERDKQNTTVIEKTVWYE
jgi:hypothetical protein